MSRFVQIETRKTDFAMYKLLCFHFFMFPVCRSSPSGSLFLSLSCILILMPGVSFWYKLWLVEQNQRHSKKKQTIVRISFQLHVCGWTPAPKLLRPSNQDKIQMHLLAALGFRLCQVLMGMLFYNRWKYTASAVSNYPHNTQTAFS